ncbi:hypothetical protein BBK82_28395 [Lentzea guizhouensis]|uniref:Vitamin K epoxide reductase domain-containing protein n=1 Tax=Lentzea guizhouensis TaxID=1586287 RepID=A0A1B2HNT4_9PSEU|nr:vitamin K epoxide reductase family protein [Lentzea guizhouensis]ANZ39387.1 hypothetical protein BBK82_28395 [Lentzea guizhouensis]
MADCLPGLASSLVLTIEKTALLRDSACVPTCSINQVLSCGSPQAELFGFPTRCRASRASQRATSGVAFVHRLMHQSLAVIVGGAAPISQGLC